jgi:mitochondrial division protein 1
MGEMRLGAVKCLQVEDITCITGGTDGSVRVWDLDKAEEEEAIRAAAVHVRSSSSNEARTDSIPSALRDGQEGKKEADWAACSTAIDGHTREVTALYFDGNCLVGGEIEASSPSG